MRSTFKVLFYVNGSKEKNVIVPIMGRVTINGSVAQFSCKLTIAKTMWNAKGNRAKGKSKEARDINLALDNIMTLRAAIKAIFKSGTLNPATTQRCDLATPTSWATFYNLEAVITLAFRLNTYEASRIRQKVFKCLLLQKEKKTTCLYH